VISWEAHITGPHGVLRRYRIILFRREQFERGQMLSPRARAGSFTLGGARRKGTDMVLDRNAADGIISDNVKIMEATH